jgi:hypothetical protein
MTWLIALAVGLAAGAHTATWGMYKDAPHEGFTWPRYSRSILLSGAIAIIVQAVARLDLATHGGVFVLFAVTYVSERACTEFYKTFLREEDQSKYFIPMQFAVRGHVVASRGARLAIGAAVAIVAFAIIGVIATLESAGQIPRNLWTVLLVGSLGGWFSAFGGAWKDAPIEGFETLKFFRSPVFAALWALPLARSTDSFLLIGLGALGLTIATLETYKTFFFPSKPRGKFAGKPVSNPKWLRLRTRFVPVYVAVWILVIVAGALSLATSPAADLPAHGSSATGASGPM